MRPDLTQLVRQRLVEGLPSFTGRVLLASDFAALLARAQLPQVTPAMVVLPAGMRGGESGSTVAQYQQSITRWITVVLIIRAPNQSPAHERRTADVEALTLQVIAALVGWAPDNTIPGVLRFDDGSLRVQPDGTLIYELRFSIIDEVRL